MMVAAESGEAEDPWTGHGHMNARIGYQVPPGTGRAWGYFANFRQSQFNSKPKSALGVEA
jgi:hypothetical protein